MGFLDGDDEMCVMIEKLKPYSSKHNNHRSERGELC